MLQVTLAALHLLALGLGLVGAGPRAQFLAQAARATPRGEALRQAFAADARWGFAALLWIGTGLWRLLAETEKSVGYYMRNPLFHAKMGLLAAILLLELWPMVTLIRWRVAIRRGADPDVVAAPRAARRIAAVSTVQSVLVVIMIFLAVGMARGFGARPGGVKPPAARAAPRPGLSRGVLLYLHGFASGPSSFKARELSRRFAARGVALDVPDLTPGADGFERSSPGSMLAVAEARLASAAPPHALVGSSLGGYLSAVAASRAPSIERLVLLAPAFRLFDRWSARLTPAELEGWRADGLETMHFASGRRRRIGWQFFEGARGWPAFPEVSVPTLCVAGTRDETVPIADVEAFVARTPSARLVAVDDGHELTASIDRIFEETAAFLAPFTDR